jgi:hypothetical protein
MGVFSSFFGFPLKISIPHLFFTHLSQIPELLERPERAAHYQVLDL